MNKPLLLFFTIFTATVASAQVSIDIMDMPMSGNSYISPVTYSVSALTPGTEGSNQTWDYSSLIAETQDTTSWVSPAVTPYADEFPTATSSEISEGVYSYYNASATEVNFLGIPFEEEGTEGLFLKYNPPVQMFSLPITFGDSHRSTGTGFITMESTEEGVDSVRMNFSQTYDYSVDAWGTISTPTGTYDALRLRTKLINSVTTDVYFTGLGWMTFGQPNTSGTSAYIWWAEGIGEPVFGLDYSDTTWTSLSNASWYGSTEDVVITKVKNLAVSDISLAPNPSDGVFVIKAGDSEKIYSVEIFDITGTSIKSIDTESNVVPVRIPDLDEGFYTVKINSSNGVGTKKLIIKK